MRAHAKGMLAYIRYRVTAAAESLDAGMQKLKTIARGFRSFEHYRTSILFHFGALDLMPREGHWVLAIQPGTGHAPDRWRIVGEGATASGDRVSLVTFAGLPHGCQPATIRTG